MVHFLNNKDTFCNWSLSLNIIVYLIYGNFGSFSCTLDKEYYDNNYSNVVINCLQRSFFTKKPFVLDVIILLWIRKNVYLVSGSNI